MPSSFDPYHKWLGIPPKDQPPHHYRLLGIEKYEDDDDVIDAAANRLMAYLHDLGAGSEAAHSQRLLNEISKARIVLLNDEKKAAYDEKLRQETAVAMPAIPVAPLAVPAPRPPSLNPPKIAAKAVLAPPDGSAPAKAIPADEVSGEVVAAEAVPAEVPGEVPGEPVAEPVAATKVPEPPRPTSPRIISKPRKPRPGAFLFLTVAAALLLLAVAAGAVMFIPRGDDDDKPKKKTPVDPPITKKVETPVEIEKATIAFVWKEDERKNALVTIGDQTYKAPKKGSMHYAWEPGAVQVVLKRPGFEDISTSFSLKPGETTTYRPNWIAIQDVGPLPPSEARINLAHELVGYWPFEGDLIDHSPTDSKASSTQPNYVAGRIGQGLEISLQDSVLIAKEQYVRGGECTIAFWYRVQNEPEENQVILDTNDGKFHYREGRIVFDTGPTTDDPAATIPPGILISDRIGAWVHIGVVYNSQLQHIGYYLNGKRTSEQRLESSRDLRVNLVRTTAPGTIDEIRLYKRALADNEVAAVFSHNLRPLAPPPTTASQSLIAEVWRDPQLTPPLVQREVSKVTATPTEAMETLNEFQLVGKNDGVNRLIRVRSYVHVPADGQYTFEVTARDPSNPEDAVLVDANITKLFYRSSSAEGLTTLDGKTPIDMKADTAHYLELLHYDNGDTATELSVNWTSSNDLAEAPLPLSRLSGYGKQPDAVATTDPGDPMVDPGTDPLTPDPGTGGPFNPAASTFFEGPTDNIDLGRIPVDGAASVMASFYEGRSAGVTLGLLGGDEVLGTDHQFTLKQTEGESQWIVLLDDAPVARFDIKDDDLRFQWAKGRSEMALHLRNCLAEVRGEGSTQVIKLRKPAMVPEWELAESTGRPTSSVVRLADVDSHFEVKVEVTDVRAPIPLATIEPVVVGAKSGQSAELSLLGDATSSEAFTEISATTQSDGHIQFHSLPKYRLASKGRGDTIFKVKTVSGQLVGLNRDIAGLEAQWAIQRRNLRGNEFRDAEADYQAKRQIVVNDGEMLTNLGQLSARENRNLVGIQGRVFIEVAGHEIDLAVTEPAP